MDGPGTLAALTPGDAGEVLTLQRAAFVTEAQAYPGPAHPAADPDPGGPAGRTRRTVLRCWGIREAGRLVACVRARVSSDSGELIRLVVAPGRQGQGIGTRLLLATEDLLPPQVRSIGLFTGQRSHANLRLYQRQGYRQTQTTRAGTYLLVHLAKARPDKSGAAAFRPGCS